MMDFSKPIIEIREIEIAQWVPDGGDKPTQVHIVLELMDAVAPPFVMRIKSKAALVSIVAALREHGQDVFGDLDGAQARGALAAYAHEAWSGWMRYQFSKCRVNNLDEFLIPASLVERWQRQMSTAYTDLPENEKASDQDEADKILALLKDVKP